MTVRQKLALTAGLCLIAMLSACNAFTADLLSHAIDGAIQHSLYCEDTYIVIR